ncbi:YhfT family protein [Lacticaseibacillus rhamnosus]|uniref:YhfT family protein n=1 Tax=Lacticaseibacillus rhamnosus TaxID=47715 RepID=UPI0007DE8951|nr:YhfT family protein [Lacticaseibacillus rhamnosus]OAU11130.1 membrane protein [Lacticaseibacillus rhamnosus]
MCGSVLIDYVLIALVGGVGSILANRGIAVFNDGLRPIMPEYLEGKIDRKELAATSFAVSFGLIIGFGIPVSIGSTILVAHSILLAADIIGTWTPANKWGTALAGVVGAVYGVGLLFGLSFIVSAFKMLPVNFLGALSLLGGPILLAFCAFPALAVASQHGAKKGMITFGATFVAYLLATKFGVFSLGNGIKITLNPIGMSLLVAMLFMLYFAAQIKGEGTSNASLVNVFSARVSRIKKNWIWLSIMGGLITAASSVLIIAVDVLPQQLLVKGQVMEAAIATLARAIGFIPLVFSTAIVTGVYGMAGTTIIFAIGLLLKGNPIVAFIAGFVWMWIEVQALAGTAKGLDKFPGLRDMGEHIRTSLTDTIAIALLIGAALACNKMAPNLGYFWVIGVWLLNKKLKKPLVDMAVGPIAAIALGILLNLLRIVHLF